MKRGQRERNSTPPITCGRCGARIGGVGFPLARSVRLAVGLDGGCREVFLCACGWPSLLIFYERKTTSVAWRPGWRDFYTGLYSKRESRAGPVWLAGYRGGEIPEK